MKPILCLLGILLLAAPVRSADLPAHVDPWHALDIAQAQWSERPLTAEAATYRALQALVDLPLDNAQRERLHGLTTLPPLAHRPHPEGAGLRLPIYPNARLARSLLLADTQRLIRVSSALAAQSGAEHWLDGLLRTADPANWSAGLAPAGPQAVAGLIGMLRLCSEDNPRCADSLLRFPSQFDAADLAIALERASADVRIRFAQRAVQQDDPHPRHAVQLAASMQPDIAGILHQSGPVGAAKSSLELGLLADPLRGADLAARLASTLDATLLQQLEQRFMRSDSLLEQQRLILILRLSGQAGSASRIATWLASPAALPELQRSVGTW